VLKIGSSTFSIILQLQAIGLRLIYITLVYSCKINIVESGNKHHSLNPLYFDNSSEENNKKKCGKNILQEYTRVIYINLRPMACNCRIIENVELPILSTTYNTGT
jgi:hypothetical protein